LERLFTHFRTQKGTQKLFYILSNL